VSLVAPKRLLDEIFCIFSDFVTLLKCFSCWIFLLSRSIVGCLDLVVFFFAEIFCIFSDFVTLLKCFSCWIFLLDRNILG